MLRVVVGALLLVQLSLAYDGDACHRLYQQHELSPNFNETIAHAIHSFTVNDLQKFKPEISKSNGVPVVNPRLNDPTTTVRVIPDAPYEVTGSDFDGETMNTIDAILVNIGQPTDGLGLNWSPLERVVHKFHMRDLWAKLVPIYGEVMTAGKLENDICDCLTDVRNNGIFEAVDWVALHYKSGTQRFLFRLLNSPIPKFTDSSSWKIWKASLLHYYDKTAMMDAAKYLACALNEY